MPEDARAATGALQEPGRDERRAALRAALAPVGIWTGQLDMVPAARAQELAAELEELGYRAVWLPEVAGRDVFVHLALLLSATRRLIGATGIANIWARDAVTMAGAMKGLTEAFPDRVVIGLGVSHKSLVEDLRGHRYEQPLTAMRRYLGAVDASPYTAQRPAAAPWRVLAALGPKMLALAAEAADGAHPYFVTPEHTASARATLGPDRLLCPEQAVLLEQDPSRAREVGRAYTALYLSQPNYVRNLRRLGFPEEDLQGGGSDRLVDALVAWGDEEAIVRRVQAHLDAGADHVGVQPLPTERRGVPDDQWRRLAPALTGLRRTGA
jgi:probable F420-dependent oxidoreductase